MAKKANEEYDKKFRSFLARCPSNPSELAKRLEEICDKNHKDYDAWFGQRVWPFEPLRGRLEEPLVFLSVRSCASSRAST